MSVYIGNPPLSNSPLTHIHHLNSKVKVSIVQVVRSSPKSLNLKAGHPDIESPYDYQVSSLNMDLFSFKILCRNDSVKEVFQYFAGFEQIFHSSPISQRSQFF